jgi:MFS family permease
MLLPSMVTGSRCHTAKWVVISTSNFVGYLVGAVLSGRLIVRLGARRLIAAGLATIAVSLMIISISSSFWSSSCSLL